MELRPHRVVGAYPRGYCREVGADPPSLRIAPYNPALTRVPIGECVCVV